MRFAFGKNWRHFLRSMNNERLESSKAALAEMLGDISGKTFLDVGCGSGLSSLAAYKAGAKVYSFDYDPESVECAKELQRMYGVSWPVEQGSALDTAYLAGLGEFDIVYSWGVLHHTGDMWKAMQNLAHLVGPDGRLFVSIYNDQGRMSHVWKAIKYLYNKYMLLRPFIVAAAFVRLRVPSVLMWKGTPRRGMSSWHDLIDWVGGYPFEVAKPEAIFSFYKALNFHLCRLKTCGGGLGCNEFVFGR